MALTLPQPDIPVFTGDPVEYCDFTQAFENLIERKTSSPSTRLYLPPAVHEWTGTRPGTKLPSHAGG